MNIYYKQASENIANYLLQQMRFGYLEWYSYILNSTK